MRPLSGLTIDGAEVQTAERIDVIDPSSGQVIGTAPDATQAHVAQAVAAAARAFPAWAADSDARTAPLREAAARVRSAAEELAWLTTREQGKPLAAAVGEAMAAAQFLDDFAAVRPQIELDRDDGVNVAQVRRRPIGVIAAISPWNSAIYVTAMKIAPALAAGNTVVIKPAPETPGATLRLGELMRDVFPAGVVNVLTGQERVGPWLTASPDVRLVSFTGSIATGRRIASAAGADLKRVVLELGGNDAAIVLDDASLDDTVLDTLFWNAFGNAGQVCSGIKRIYVHRSLCQAMVDGFAERARTVRVGPGLDPATQMGPLTTAAQRARVAGLVDDAIRDGAKLMAGGRVPDRPGFFYEPTVVLCDRDEIALVAQEQFGPAVPILAFDSDDEAIARANLGEYGLGGSVWTSDFDRGAALAARLESGMAWVNSHKGIDPTLPFGGAKSSGAGVERGRWGMDCLTELHSISGIRMGVTVPSRRAM
jgi:acyl-CoA reductase-like NAD-dependent aldehyde dehydrogenase